jgi:isocitrate dehydrogenase
VHFAGLLEGTVIKVVEDGFMTKDLADSIYGKAMVRSHWLNTEDFILKVAQVLRSKMQVPKL